MRRPAILAAILAAAVLGPASVLAQNAAPTRIKIATEGAFAPWNLTTPSGKLDGFEIELANDLCRRMQITCEIVAQDWDGIIPALQAGKYDAIMAGMAVTPKREAVLGFSRSYAGEPSGLMAPRTGPLAKLPETGARLDFNKDPAAAEKVIEAMKPILKGSVIGVQVSTIHSDFLNRYFKDVVEIREYKTTEQHDLDLLAGRVDGVFGSGGTIRATLEKPEFKEFGLQGPRFSGGVFGKGVSVGLRKEDTGLKQKFDEAISAALADGTIKALTLKWFKTDISPQG